MCNSATIAEAKRQGAAELAKSLRARLASRRNTRATLIYISELAQWLDELAPTVTCDNPPTDTYHVCRDDATGLYGVVSSDGGLLYDSDMSEDEANSLALAHNAGCASYEEALLWLNWI